MGALAVSGGDGVADADGVGAIAGVDAAGVGSGATGTAAGVAATDAGVEGDSHP